MNNLTTNNLTTYLKQLGVEYIFFGAGARNESLLDELAEFKQEISFDERSLSFKALGMSKLTKRPVVVCTTSGTAVSQCFSAMIEAYYSGVKLIMLSADRPQRLRGSRAPQTINQVDIFSPYIETSFSGPLNEFHTSEDIKYPMHLNIEIETVVDSPARLIKNIEANELIALLNEHTSVVGIFSESDISYEKELHALDAANIPFYIECTGPLKNFQSKNRIRFEKTLLALLENNELDVVVKFGMTPFTKLWRSLDQNRIKPTVIGISPHKLGLSQGYMAQISSTELSDRLKPKNPWDRKNYKLEPLLAKYPTSEISLFNTIYKSLNENDIIFVGNSMPIRYWQMVDRGSNPIYASRGANGIDGQISTAIGMALSCKEIVHCIIGDVTFLYDLNSLVEEIPPNLKIHVMNNRGGRIFTQIKINPKMTTEHKLLLKELTTNFPAHQQIFEYHPDLEQTSAFWQEWNNQ